ncbi:unnamed protein product [Musa hybrid cultivar]
MLHRGAKWRQFSLNLPLPSDLSLLLPSPSPNSTAWIALLSSGSEESSRRPILLPLPHSLLSCWVRWYGLVFVRIWAKGSRFRARYQAASDDGSDSSVGRDGGRGDGGSYDGGGHENDDGNDRFFLSWYLMALDKHPVITKALICQLLIDQVSKLDLRRTFVFTFLGLSLVGPTLHFWYLYLSKLLTFPGASGAFLRLLLDQIYIFCIFI